MREGEKDVSNELIHNNFLQIVSNDNTRRKSPFVDYEPTTSYYITQTILP